MTDALSRHGPRAPRERLTGLLDRAAEVPLVVVCAPAGYGKTTAVDDWLTSRERRTARLAMDADDNEVENLFPRLLGISAELAEAYGTPTSVVLDDYQMVTTAASHRAVRILIDRLPSGVQTIVVSRTRPPLGLGRRRADGDVFEIGAEDLAFTAAETDAFLNGRADLGLSDEQLDRVTEALAGWPAGLALAAGSLSADPGVDEFRTGLELAQRHSGQFLREEVLAGLDPKVRDFLLRSSILDRLRPSLCAAVLDDPDASNLLVEVRDEHQLVAESEDADGWLRLPRPFAAVLRRELIRAEGEQLPGLHDRASRWYEAAGMAEEAIRHAGLACDGPRAAALVYGSGDQLLDEGGYKRVYELIEAIPADRGAYGPYCEVVEVMARSRARGNLSFLDQRVRELKARYPDAPGVSRLVERILLTPFFGRVAATAESGLELLERSATEPPAFRAAVAAKLGIVAWFDGRRDTARDLLESHLDAMATRWHDIALAGLSLLAADDGDPELAVARAERAGTPARTNDAGLGLDGVFIDQALANGLIGAGRHEDADRTLARSETITDAAPRSLYAGFTHLLRAELELRRHDRRRAARAADGARAAVDRHADSGILAERLDLVEKILAARPDAGVLGSRPTPAEHRVLELLDRDLTFTEIAAELFLSIHTVKSHSQRLYRRFGVNSRGAAVEMARERGLLKR